MIAELFLNSYTQEKENLVAGAHTPVQKSKTDKLCRNGDENPSSLKKRILSSRNVNESTDTTPIDNSGPDNKKQRQSPHIDKQHDPVYH